MAVADMAQVMVSTRKFDSRLTKKCRTKFILQISLSGLF